MSVDVSGLPNDPQVLKQMILDWSSRYDNLEKKLALATEEIEYWRKKIFAKKSEKFSEEDMIMGQLFNEAELTEIEMELQKNKTTEKIILVPMRRRQKQGGRKPLPDNLPRKTTIIELTETERMCHQDGKPMRKIGEEKSEKLHVDPINVWVEEIIRYKYACEICEGTGSEDEGGAVRIAPVPVQLFPKSIATPSLIAYIAASKFCDSLPFYRLSRMMERMGISIPRQTMARWMVELSELLQPLLDLLKKIMLTGSMLGIDETRLQVLNEPDKAATSLSYMWVFCGGTKEKPVVLFKYLESRSGKFLLDFLAGYKGYVQTDDFSGYDILEPIEEIILVGCWAHARRRFFDAAKASKIAGSAHEGLKKIRQLYAIEDEARKGNFDSDEIKSIRQEKSVPVLADIKAWLDEKKHQAPPACLLGKAINYALNNWDKLNRYVEDGKVPIDNNGVENKIRPYVVGRKNWLFADSPGGAHASAALYTFVENGKANGLEPYWLLRYVLEKLPYAKTEDDYKALLPQFIDKTEFSAFRYRDRKP